MTAEEPKLEFDWRDGKTWGIYKHGKKEGHKGRPKAFFVIRDIHKRHNWISIGTDHKGYLLISEKFITKKRIIQYYIPCPPPTNAEDYFSTQRFSLNR